MLPPRRCCPARGGSGLQARLPCSRRTSRLVRPSPVAVAAAAAAAVAVAVVTSSFALRRRNEWAAAPVRTFAGQRIHLHVLYLVNVS